MKTPEHLVFATWRFTKNFPERAAVQLAEAWASDPNFLSVVVHFGRDDAPRISYLYRLMDGEKSTCEKRFHKINEGLIARFGLDEEALRESAKRGNPVRRANGIQGWSHCAPMVKIAKQVELT